MDALLEKHFISSRSLQYTYYASPISNATAINQPTLLLLHGFPESAATWAFVIPYILSLGLRILVPDLLGYGGTSKPWDVSAFSADAMTKDLAEILTFENVSSVIPVGHDWGAYLAHRYYLFYPEQVDAVIVSSYYYQPPIREPINVTQITEERQELVGFPLGWYYAFFSSPDAASIISGHVESFLSAGYGEDGAMKETFGYKDSLRNWLLGDKRRTLQEFARDPARVQQAQQAFGNGGFVSPLLWYTAFVNGTQYAAEKDLPDAADSVDVPLLHIAGEHDPLGPPALFDTQEAKSSISDLTNVAMNAGHFLPEENPSEMADIIIKWLASKDLIPA